MKNLQIANDDYGVTAFDGIPVVSSRDVAKKFKKQHKDVLRAIKNCNCSEEFSQRNFTPTTYKDSQGKKQPEILMTKDGFAFIVMGFTGKKAAQFKEMYIKRFNEMEQFIKNRNIAKLEYPELTDMIKQAHENPKYYHYSNEADMINRIVLGMPAREVRKKFGLAKGESIRDHLLPWQVEAIQRLQKVDVGFVIAIPDFQERKKALKAYYEKIRNTLNPPKQITV